MNNSPALAAVPPVTHLLAAFASQSVWEAFPAPVRHNVRGALVNGVANIIGGTHDPCMDRLLAAMAPFMGRRRATLLGRLQRADLPTAAFLNAVSANVLDFDDTHLPSLVHPGATVLPPLLALAEAEPVSGPELLAALAVGIEVACRLGMAMHPSHYAHGWHITTTCGAVGAAAGAARLLRLDSSQTAHALGIAATTASGLIENLSSMAKSVGVGNAARGGLMAAFMAREGIEAAATALEGPFGFLQVFAAQPRYEAAVAGLGSHWELLARFAKPYPSCALSFPVIDGALDIWGRPGFAASRVRQVLVTGNPLMLVRAGRSSVSTGREAKLSIRHSVAIALLHGSAGVQDYLDSTVNDAATVGLSQRVDCASDAGIATDAAHVRVEMEDGTVHEAHVAQGRGTPARPLSDEELDDKARGLICFAAPQLAAEDVIAALWAVEDQSDLSPLFAVMVPAALRVERPVAEVA